MTDTFEQRKKGFERNFVQSAELEFRAEARRNRFLAQWAAEKMGLNEQETRDYVATMIRADLEEIGDLDVFRKIRADFDAAGVKQSDHQLRRTMNELMEKARAEIRSGS